MSEVGSTSDDRALKPRTAKRDLAVGRAFSGDISASPLVQVYHAKIKSRRAGLMSHAPATLLVIGQARVLASATRQRECRRE